MNKSAFDTVFKWNTAWTPTVGGFNVRRTDLVEPWFVPENEVAIIDNRLPEAIRILAKNKPYVGGERIAHMARLWNVPLHIEADEGIFVAIESIYEIDIDDESVCLHGSVIFYTPHALPNIDQPVNIPLGIDTAVVVIERTRCDQKFPGWLERHATSVAIGLSPLEVFSHMVSSEKPAKAAALPDDFISGPSA